MLGPNCLGVYYAAASLDLGMNEFAPGAFGIISQSGNLALELSLLGAQYGVGVSRFASLGNEADIDAAEFLVEAFAADERTRVIGVYCEDFHDGRAFARAGAAAVAAGKQVVLLAAGGGSEAGARAAASHTGALASDTAAVDAACRAARILRVATPKELFDRALARAWPRTAREAGGSRSSRTAAAPACVTADLVSAAGLELPMLSDGLAARLTAISAGIVTTNPVDLAGAGEQDFWNFERVTTTVLESGEVDSVIFTGYFGGYSQMNEAFGAFETRSRTASPGRRLSERVRLLAQAMFWDSPPARALRAGGVPVYRDIEAVVETLRHLVEQHEAFASGIPDPGAAAPPVEGDGYFESRGLLAAAGIPFGAALRATSIDAVRAAAADLGYPVVLKALGLLTSPTRAALRSGSSTTPQSPRPRPTCTSVSRRRRTRWRRSSTSRGASS